MIRRIAQWFSDRRDWAGDHEAAWQGMTSPGAGGLSRFQHDCENALAAMLTTSGRTLTERTVSGSAAEPYVTGKVSDSALTIWIYTDQVNVDGPELDARFEQWDARTPHDLIAQFCALVAQQLEVHSPAV